jgi:hypothetical protein
VLNEVQRQLTFVPDNDSEEEKRITFSFLLLLLVKEKSREISVGRLQVGFILKIYYKEN